jgi:hypothetical protein
VLKVPRPEKQNPVPISAKNNLRESAIGIGNPICDLALP